MISGVIITDGVSNIQHFSTIPEAEMAKEAGIHIFTIGVGLGKKIDELHAMASLPAKKNSFAVDTFADLRSVVEKLVQNMCEGRAN